jgi:hypothetical protein
MTIDQLRMLLGELGQRIGLEGIEIDEDGYAVLAFDEVFVSFEVDEEGGLLLYSHLGVPGGDAAALHREMLDANLFWGATGGATLAREGMTGGIVLQQRRPLQGMDINAFEALLKAFVDTAEGWTKRLGEGAPEPAAAAVEAEPPGMDPMMRV